jgi:hypothetical protein
MLSQLVPGERQIGVIAIPGTFPFAALPLKNLSHASKTRVTRLFPIY